MPVIPAPRPDGVSGKAGVHLNMTTKAATIAAQANHHPARFISIPPSLDCCDILIQREKKDERFFPEIPGARFQLPFSSFHLPVSNFHLAVSIFEFRVSASVANRE